MGKLTFGSSIMAIVGAIVALAFLNPGLSFYSNSYFYNSANSLYNYSANNYNSVIYQQVYYQSLNSSSGFRSSGLLQQFTGLAFQFGSFFQIMQALLSAPTILFNAFALFISWISAFLPPLVISSLLLVAFATPTIFLILAGLTDWVKVEQD